MSNIFFISDYHFGHSAPYNKFLKSDGTFLRNEFSSYEEADEAMVDRHNKTVSKRDKTYVLGDITFSKKFLPILDRLNGEKVLIRGNHDTEKASIYLKYFKDVRGSHQFDGMLITHIPVHPDSLSRWGFNVHGHTHGNRVMKRKVVSQDWLRVSAEIIPDPRYFCVSVEQINYTPIAVEEVLKARKLALEV